MRRFGSEQLSPLKTADIVDNTAGLVAASAFFSGAWQVLAGGQARQFADSQAGLSRYLAQCFHLSEENAAALLDAARVFCPPGPPPGMGAGHAGAGFAVRPGLVALVG